MKNNKVLNFEDKRVQKVTESALQKVSDQCNNPFMPNKRKGIEPMSKDLEAAKKEITMNAYQRLKTRGKQANGAKWAQPKKINE